MVQLCLLSCNHDFLCMHASHVTETQCKTVCSSSGCNGCVRKWSTLSVFMVWFQRNPETGSCFAGVVVQKQSPEPLCSDLDLNFSFVSISLAKRQKCWSCSAVSDWVWKCFLFTPFRFHIWKSCWPNKVNTKQLFPYDIFK